MALPDLNRSLIRRTTVPVEPGLKVCVYDFATKSAAAAVLAAGFFNFARGYLRPGDRIEAITEMDNAAASATVRMKVLTVPATGNVTVADLDA
jgi:hypothetical protein